MNSDQISEYYLSHEQLQQIEIQKQLKIMDKVAKGKKSRINETLLDPIYSQVFIGWEDELNRKKRIKTQVDLREKIPIHRSYSKQNYGRERVQSQILYSHTVQLPNISKNLPKHKQTNFINTNKHNTTTEPNQSQSQKNRNQNKEQAQNMKRKLIQVVQKVYKQKQLNNSKQKSLSKQKQKVLIKKYDMKKIKLQKLKFAEAKSKKEKNHWEQIDVLKLQTYFVKMLKNRMHQKVSDQINLVDMKQSVITQKLVVPKKQKIPDFIRDYKAVNPQINIDQLVNQENFQIIVSEGEEIYIGCMENGKRNKKGIYLCKNYRFQGIWKNDMKHSGCEITTQGYYRGKFRDNKRCGQGQFYWKNGQIYEGEWVNGLRHGSGIWKSNKGDNYIGQWSNGKVEGYGVHMTAAGQKYEGYFTDFLKNGKGKQFFPNGDFYEGDYKSGRPWGKGKYTWKNGIVYEGQFVEGYRHGMGKIIAQKYLQFQGIFIGQKPNGKGQIKYENGDSFKGELKNGQKHGYGVLRLKNQHKVMSGIWKRNALIDEIQGKKQ